MIPRPELIPNWTANDPEPKMILDEDRKWSRQKMRNGMEFGFSEFFFTFYFIYEYVFFLNLTIM